MTPEEITVFIAEQRAIDKSRTQGEWLAYYAGHQPTNHVGYFGTDDKNVAYADGPDPDQFIVINTDDAAFICVVSRNYPKLLDLVEAQQAELAALKAKFEAERGEL